MVFLTFSVFRSSSSDSFLQTHSSDAVLQTHSSRCFKLQIKFLCSWTCWIRIFMNSTLIMDPVHLNKLFSISNWLFIIPCYCQNSIGDLWNTLVPTTLRTSRCWNKGCFSKSPLEFSWQQGIKNHQLDMLNICSSVQDPNQSTIHKDSDWTSTTRK